MNFEFNKGMKVFSKLYVGMQTRGGSDRIPLGFATPHEENAAGRKRQETVDRWCGDDGEKKIIDNIPREGFKITDNIKRVYWGGGNVVFRVYDPAGFELEIQSANLMAIINSVGIEAGGLIPGKCLWGRDAGDNILIHETSEEYKTARLAAETIKKPKEIASNERAIGDEYVLLDGSNAIYGGKMWVVTDADDENYTQIYVTVRNQTGTGKNYRKRIEADKADLFDAVIVSGQVRFYKKAPLITLIKKGALTKEETKATIQRSSFVFASSSKTGNICYVSYKKPTKLEYQIVPWSKDEFDDRLQSATKSSSYYPSDEFSWWDFFGSRNGFAGVRLNGVLYADPFTIWVKNTDPNVKQQSVAIRCLGQIQLNGASVSHYTGGGDGSYYGSSGYSYLHRGLGWNPSIGAHVSTVLFDLHQFPTKDKARAWCKTQFDEGRLFFVKVADVG